MEFGRKAEAIAAALALGLGVAACGSDNGYQINKAPKQPSGLKNSGEDIRVEYFSDGTRKLAVGDIDTVFEFCDGHDLVEISEIAGANSDAGAAISRSVDHPACADGRLTPSDFQLHPTAK